MADDEAKRDSAQSASRAQPAEEGAAESSTPALRTGGDRTSREGALDRTEVLPTERRDSAAAAPDKVVRTEPLGTARTAPLLSPPGGAEQPGGAESASDVRPARRERDAALEATIAMHEGDGAIDFDLRPFGPYDRVEVLREQGSIGLVARGHNADIGRWELLKFLRSEYQGIPEVVRQFRGEGRVLALLSHPNVVQVFAAYELDGHTCLALEFLEGESLEARVERGVLNLEEGSKLFLEAARGLAAAHEIGLLHRDIKPENLFVAREARGKSGGLKLIDFGLATLDRTRRIAVTQDPSLDSGAVGGTPLFMAPELWLGREPSVKSDLYALGLTFYFAFTGAYPFAELSLAGVRQRLLDDQPFPSLAQALPEAPGALVELIDRLIAKEPKQRPESADEIVAQLVSLSAQTARPEVPESGPYRGLSVFTAEERGVFFGRAQEVSEICERLRLGTGCVLVGPSGSGKSSLARAGVLPSVSEGALGGASVWSTVTCRLGTSPAESLAHAVAQATGARADEVKNLIASEPERLAGALLEALPTTRGLLILVDQLEELVQRGVSQSEVERVARALGSLGRVAQSRVRLLATLRADSMDGLFAFEPLRQLLTQGFYPMRPLSEASLRAIIEEPARAAGYHLEDSGLSAAILAEAKEIPEVLPLLSFALSAWWRHRDQPQHALTRASWQRIGGIAGALVIHAEQVLEGMRPEERRAAEQLLVRLVSDEKTRLSVPKTELLEEHLGRPEVERALSLLIESKLLISAGGAVQLAHEALIQRWPRLTGRLIESGEDQAFRARVSEAARQWDADGRGEGSLWDGDQATRLLSWFERSEANLGQRELLFVEAVRRRDRRSRWLRRGGLVAIVSVMLVLLLVSRAREQSLSSRVSELEQQQTTAKRTSDQSLGLLYAELAQRRLPGDPAGALKAARLSRDYGQRSDLDLVGWRAVRLGIPRALPANPSGLEGVVFDPDSAWLAALWQDDSLRVLELGGEGDREYPVGKSPGQELLGFSSDSTRVIWRDHANVRELKRADGSQAPLLHCEGALQRAVWVTSNGEGELSVPKALVAQCDGGGENLHWLSLAEQQSGLPAVPGEHFAASPSRWAVVSQDQLTLWDVASARSVGKLKLPKEMLGVIDRMVVLADAVLLATKSGGLWEVSFDAEHLQKARELPQRHRQRIRQLISIPGGAISSDARHRVVWQRKAGVLQPVRDEPDPTGSAVELGARRLLAWSREGAVDLWTADVRQRAGRLSLGSERAALLSASPNGRWLAVVTQSRRALVFDLELAASRYLSLKGAGDCQLAADGLSMGCLGEQLVLQSAEGRKQARTFPESAAPAPRLKPTEGASARWALGRGEFAAWVAASGQLAVLGKAGPRLLDLGSIQALVAAPDSEKLGLLIDQAGQTSLAVLDGENVVRIPTETKSLRALAFSPDGSLIVLGDAAGVLFTLDASRLDSPALLSRAPVGAVQNLVFSSDHREILSLGSKGAAITDVSARSSRPLPSLPADAACGAFSRSGRALVIGTKSGEILLFDRDSNQLHQVSSGSPGIFQCVRVPSEDRFLFASTDGSTWSEAFDLRAIWMLPDPDDPKLGAPEPWRGLTLAHQN
ncbi:MAG: protein kinase [Polyangiaceae bacterium]